jgi:hypothetical protein
VARNTSSNVGNTNQYGIKSQKILNLHIIVHKEWTYSDALVTLAEKTPTLELSRVGSSITLPNISAVFCCCSTVHFDKYQSFFDQQMHTLLT